MISLIIPCYNSEKYIGRCLESVLEQTDTDIELIVVNDGSTDRTAQIIKGKRKRLEEQLSRFIYLEQNNQGVGAACNNAFKHVSGKYLALLDSDDVMLPKSMELRRQWLDEHESYGLVRTNGYYVTEDSFDVLDRLLEVNDYMKKKEDIFEELFYGTTYVWPGTYMIRVSVLEEIYPDREIYPSRHGQNLQFLMMAAYKSNAGFIDEPLMKYVIQKESLSHFSSGDVMQKKIDAMLGYKSIREYLITEYMPKNEAEKWKKEIDILYEKIFVKIACEYNNMECAEEHYLKLKKLLGKNCDINTRITYYRLKNRIIYWLLRIARRLRIVT